MEGTQVIDVDVEKKLILKEYRALLRSLKKNVSPQKKRWCARRLNLL